MGITMAKSKSARPLTPPKEVCVEFLRRLHETVTEYDNIVPVLRGSLLLSQWFGNEARPAADIDLECFRRFSEESERPWRPLVEYGKLLCMSAAQSTQDYEYLPPDIEFRETDVPADGVNLWEYGTPGERCYTGWVWHSRDDLAGLLQIDVAQAAAYDLADIGVADIELAAPGSDPFRFPAYTPELLLAAKLSWLLRSVKPRKDPDDSRPPQWTGEPKDLFDAHLLLTRASLHAEQFQNSLMAVGTADKLDWTALDALFDLRRAALTDADFPGWNEFRQQHEGLIYGGPAELLRTIVDHLEPLLGDFRQHVPFLGALKEDPVDELLYLMYADWLEERGDPRGGFLRAYATLFFRKEELSPDKRAQTREALLASLQATPSPWLYQVFGSAERFREVRKGILAGAV